MKNKLKRYSHVNTQDGTVYIVKQLFNDQIRATNYLTNRTTYLKYSEITELKSEIVRVLYGSN